MRWVVSVLAGLVAAFPSLASAQQAQFAPAQCDNRTAQECNDLMGSLDVSPTKREETLLARATAALQKHDLQGAIAEYREVTVVDPESVLAFSNLAMLEGSAQDWTSATTDLKRAVSLAPEQGDLHAMLVVALAKSGDCNAAKSELADSKAKTPEAAGLAKADELVQGACP
jgi:Tfp pilus assembly protein PilF